MIVAMQEGADEPQIQSVIEHLVKMDLKCTVPLGRA